MSRKGFTLIELVMIIVILGILAAVAVPKYFDLQADAQAAAEKGVVGGVRAGIATYFAQNKAFPATLDPVPVSTACDETNPCFDNILGQGAVTEDWSKDGTGNYAGPTANTYAYDSSDGSFLKQ